MACPVCKRLSSETELLSVLVSCDTDDWLQPEEQNQPSDNLYARCHWGGQGKRSMRTYTCRLSVSVTWMLPESHPG
jgi:hypothetical protein